MTVCKSIVILLLDWLAFIWVPALVVRRQAMKAEPESLEEPVRASPSPSLALY